MTVWTRVDSPIGELLLVGDGTALTGLYLHARPSSWGPGVEQAWRRDDAAFADVADQLAAYFAGRLREFDVPLAPSGTPFQLQVWAALRTIPYGTTASYGELAAAIGKPGAARAVGAANGRNPLSIIVPCHRVVGSSGRLTGYAGGLERKRYLLALEGGQLPV